MARLLLACALALAAAGGCGRGVAEDSHCIGTADEASLLQKGNPRAIWDTAEDRLEAVLQAAGDRLRELVDAETKDSDAHPNVEFADDAHLGEGTDDPHIDSGVDPEEHAGAEDADHGTLPVAQHPDNHAGAEDPDHGAGAPHGEHHHTYSSLDVAVGACFVGFVLILMSALFLVNHSKHDVRAAAYSMVSQTLSIFCAVTLYNQAGKAISMLALPFWEDVAVRALFWLALLIAVFVRIARSDSKEPMIAAGVLGGHVVGYAALETFGSVQRQAPFVEHVIPTVVASVSLYYLVLKATLWVADHLVHGSGEDTREQKIKAIDECEEDAFSFCNGFLISQVSKFYVLGFMPVLHGEPEGHSQQECDMLFGFVGLFSMIVCVLAALQELAHASGLPSTARLLFLAQHTAGMAAAWMLVFAGEWQWFAAVETPSLSSGIMLVTFVSTMVSFGLVVVLDFVAGRGWVRPASVRALIAIIATAVGLSWEKAFHEADQALTSGLSPKTATKCKLLLIVVVLLIVLQGWRYYVLPQAIEYEEKCEEKRKAEASQAEEGQKPAEVSEPQ